MVRYAESLPWKIKAVIMKQFHKSDEVGYCRHEGKNANGREDNPCKKMGKIAVYCEHFHSLRKMRTQATYS